MGIKAFKEVEGILGQSASAWIKIIGYIRTNYIMDEFWDAKNCLKFQRSKKTLVTFYIKDKKFSALIIFGKNEREKFELTTSDFSDYINNIYDSSKTYHDGKWMFIDTNDISQADDIIKLVKIKKKPNRKEINDNIFMGKCGNRCDQCLLYVKNNEIEGGRFEFQKGDWKCYHSGDPSQSYDYSNHICNGCHNDCKVVKCTLEKGFENCGQCDYHNCKIDDNNFTNPGRCNLGLSADDITRFVMPYCGRERFDCRRNK